MYAAEEALRNLREDRQREDLEEMLASMSVLEASAVPGSQPALEIMQLPHKDVPILLAAVGVRATHLIAEDFAQFGPYGKRIGNVLILPPARYLSKHESPKC
jgi:hypothetical protein